MLHFDFPANNNGLPGQNQQSIFFDQYNAILDQISHLHTLSQQLELSEIYIAPASKNSMEYFVRNFSSLGSLYKEIVEKLRNEYINKGELAKSARELPSLDFSTNAKLFTKAMDQHSMSLVQALLEKYDLRYDFQLKSFLDVAGGSGCFWYRWSLTTG